jgi:hypothetical protein
MTIEPLIDLESLRLRDPLLVGAFLGWADASLGASGGVRFLIEALDAVRLATWDGEDYYDFVELRPVSRTVDGNDRALDWPHGEFWLVRECPTSMMGLAVPLALDEAESLDARQSRSLVLFVAPEPRMRWRSYSREMSAFVRRLGVRDAAFMGSAFADVPHTRPPLVTGWSTDAPMRVRLESLGVPFSPYQGPSSMQSAVIETLRHDGIACVSLFGNGPHYLPVPNANVSHALLRRLCASFDLAVDLGALRDTGSQILTLANNAVDERAELREHVERLEAQYDSQSMPFAPGESLRRPPEAQTDENSKALELDPKDLVRDLEEFLRRRQHEGPTEPESDDASP